MTETKIPTENVGKTRYDAGGYARLHIRINNPNLNTTEEAEAFFAKWREMFGLRDEDRYKAWAIPLCTHGPFQSLDLRVNTRREFALIPAIIRSAEQSGFLLSVLQWDVGANSEVSLDQDPGGFWKVIALSEAWFRDGVE